MIGKEEWDRYLKINSVNLGGVASRSESEKDHEYYSQMAEGKAGMMQESKNILALKSSGEQGCF